MTSAQWSLDPDKGVKGVLIAILFMLCFAFLVLCVMNLVISLVIESYIQETAEIQAEMAMQEASADDSAMGRKTDHQKRTKRRLTEAMVAAQGKEGYLKVRIRTCVDTYWAQRGLLARCLVRKCSKTCGMENGMQELDLGMMAKAAVRVGSSETSVVLQEQIQSHRTSTLNDGPEGQEMLPVETKAATKASMPMRMHHCLLHCLLYFCDHIMSL